MFGMMTMHARVVDPCAGAITPGSVTKDTDTLNACAGTGWHTVWSTTGSPGSGTEFYWEIATNAAGDNWSFHSRAVSSITRDDSTIGSDGGGSSTTVYANARVYVVPTGGDDTDACTGPVTGTQASRTDNACFA